MASAKLVVMFTRYSSHEFTYILDRWINRRDVHRYFDTKKIKIGGLTATLKAIKLSFDMQYPPTRI